MHGVTGIFYTGCSKFLCFSSLGIIWNQLSTTVHFLLLRPKILRDSQRSLENVQFNENALLRDLIGVSISAT